MNDLVLAGPEPCPFCSDAVNGVKHFILECKDLMIVLKE